MMSEISRKAAQRSNNESTNRQKILKWRKDRKKLIESLPLPYHKPTPVVGLVTQYANPSSCELGERCVHCQQHFMDTCQDKYGGRFGQNMDFLAYEADVSDSLAQSTIAKLVAAMYKGTCIRTGTPEWNTSLTCHYRA